MKIGDPEFEKMMRELAKTIEDKIGDEFRFMCGVFDADMGSSYVANMPTEGLPILLDLLKGTIGRDIRNKGGPSS